MIMRTLQTSFLVYKNYVIIDNDYFQSKIPEVELDSVLKDLNNNIVDIHSDADNVI